jgi:AraC-like DNA-binding protein
MPKGLDNRAVSSLKPERIPTGSEGNGNHSSVRYPRFDEEYFIKLSNDMIDYLEKNKPHLKANFSLHDLSAGMNVPQHHLSYCLNSVIKKCFADLKNDMRVNHAIYLLETSIVDKISIDGIGRQSGFQSPSNFYASFKRITGYTPSEWHKKNGCCDK